MSELFHSNFNHVLCFLLLVGRFGDIISTYFVTPNLMLEANPIIRKLRAPFFISTILVCLVPYYHSGFGLSFVIATYLLCFLNVSKIWFTTSIGEKRMWEITLSLASDSLIYKPILFSFIAHGFLCAIGILTIFLYPQLSSWGFFVGMGFVFFGAGSFIHSLFYIFRVFNAAKTETYILTIEKA